MNLKIGLNGASGRMGLEIAALLAPGYWVGEDCLELTLAVARTKKYTSIEGTPVNTFEDFPNDLVHAWIDFSRASGTMQLLEKIQGPLLVGTTGFSSEELAKVKEYAKKFPVVLASNTSPGMAVVRAMLKNTPVAPSLKFDVSLFEEHHKEKKDAPSGTAKTLLEILGSQGHEVQVNVSRAGGTKGIHTVRFVSEDEEIEITHRVNDRKIFAAGALMGATFLAKVKTPGLYTMDDVFGKMNGDNT